MTDPSELMQIEVQNGRVVVHLGGEIDLSNVENLEAAIKRVTGTIPHVVLDLAAIEFIDSRGLRLLNRISTATKARYATLTVIAPPNSIVRSVLDMTDMTDNLNVHGSLEEVPNPNQP